MDKEEVKTFNIITLGDSGVGKTSIIHRYVNNIFDENISTTIGMHFYFKEIIFKKKKKIKLKFIESAGQEKYLLKTYN